MFSIIIKIPLDAVDVEDLLKALCNQIYFRA